MDLQPVEVKRVPEAQVPNLTEEQLNEVFTKGLTAQDPNCAKRITRFDYTTGEFKQDTAIDMLAVHFSMDGELIAVDSDEAREQQRYESLLANKETVEKASAGTSTEDDAEQGRGGALLKNQFNFSERATQTFNNPMRAKMMNTEPPPTSVSCSNVSQWDIYDTYLNDLKHKMEQAELQEQKKPAIGKKKQEGEDDDVEIVNLEDVNPSAGGGTEPTGLARALKMMERIVHTNSEAECFQDYKYYEDKSEHKREDGRGSFLPLWRFAYEKASRKTVTAICWSPKFTDLLAVGYGSYDFAKQGSGLIACFTLKNTSHPEYTFETDSGVMCLDFHPLNSSLLCVGFYDGTVAVYDVRLKEGNPIYMANSPKVKHTDPVWQVCWSKEPLTEGKNVSFYSVSSDGRVTNWILSKNSLINEEVTELKLYRDADIPEHDPDGASTLVGLAGGCCFDFNKQNEHLFVVGTEEGSIHSYSKAYNAQHLRSFQGHHMAVYSVRWNTFNPKVFLSCSADWTVKLWESSTTRPVMTFDLNNSVGDIAWAPFSSTVFATITTDGKVRVYDLSVNKHEPIGETRVNKKAKLTHISFNPKEPIICVGDDRGLITILKLSSNLRKMSAPKLEDLDHDAEVAKLDKVMIMPEDDGLEDINALLEKVT